MAEVVALGELLIDFTTEWTDENGYPCMQAHPGGAPANLLAALAACGVKTTLLAKVGEDAFGDLLTDTVKRLGIETSGIVRDKDAFTSLAFVTVEEEGERRFSFARKPGADTRLCYEELRLSLLSSAQVFHFGSLSLTDEPSRTATRKAAALAKERGLLLSFDPNLREPLWDSLKRAREELLWGLKMADVVKLSEEEVHFLLGTEPEEGAKHLVSELGLRLVMVTLGKKGAYLMNQNAACRITAPAVSPIDTTGAGDIFGGFALAGLLKENTRPEELSEEQLRSIGTFAVTAASLSTERFGGISSVPSIEAVRERLTKENNHR